MGKQAIVDQDLESQHGGYGELVSLEQPSTYVVENSRRERINENDASVANDSVTVKVEIRTNFRALDRTRHVLQFTRTNAANHEPSITPRTVCRAPVV